jgi:hypothetical protein
MYKWNKDVEGAWRMDINVGFVDNSNIEESETNFDVVVESDAESSDSELDEAESSAPETHCD